MLVVVGKCQIYFEISFSVKNKKHIFQTVSSQDTLLSQYIFTLNPNAWSAFKIYIMWRKWPKPRVLESLPLSAALTGLAGQSTRPSLAVVPLQDVESKKAVYWP